MALDEPLRHFKKTAAVSSRAQKEAVERYKIGRVPVKNGHRIAGHWPLQWIRRHAAYQAFATAWYKPDPYRIADSRRTGAPWQIAIEERSLTAPVSGHTLLLLNTNAYCKIL